MKGRTRVVGQVMANLREIKARTDDGGDVGHGEEPHARLYRRVAWCTNIPAHYEVIKAVPLPGFL